MGWPSVSIDLSIGHHLLILKCQILAEDVSEAFHVLICIAISLELNSVCELRKLPHQFLHLILIEDPIESYLVINLL